MTDLETTQTRYPLDVVATPDTQPEPKPAEPQREEEK
jgi:hypothetical protein